MTSVQNKYQTDYNHSQTQVNQYNLKLRLSEKKPIEKMAGMNYGQKIYYA